MAGIGNQIIRCCLSKCPDFSNRCRIWKITNHYCYQSSWAGSSHIKLSSDGPGYKTISHNSDFETSNNRRSITTSVKGEHIGRTQDTEDNNVDLKQNHRTSDDELFKENERPSSKHDRSPSYKKWPKTDKEWFKRKQDKTQTADRNDGGVAKQRVKEIELDKPDYGVDHSTVFKPVQRDRSAQELLMIRRPEQPENPHLLKVAIIGTPNVGKSTLINSLLGRRIFPVSEKVHTTRSKAFAIINQDNKQIIILDTPGIVDNKTGRRHNLARSLLLDFKNSLLEADLVAVLVDASQHKAKDGLHFDVLKQLSLHPQLKSILIVNKIDMIKPRHSILGITAHLTSGKLGGKTYEISPETAAKIGSLDKWSFAKATFKPPVPNKVDKNEQNKDDLQDSMHKDDDSVSGNPSLKYSSSNTKFESRTTKSVPGGVEQLNDGDDYDAIQSSTFERSVEETCFSDMDQNSVAETSTSNSSKGNSIQDVVDEEISINGQEPCSVASFETQTLHSQSTDSDKQAIQLSKVDVMKDYLNNLQEVSKINHEDPESFEAEKEVQRRKRDKERELNKKIAAMDGGWGGFDAAFVVSAKYGEGVRELKQYLLDQSTPRDWEYHDDVVTSLTPQEIVKDAIREQLLNYLPEEVPYIVQQRNVFWGEGENGQLQIMQDIVCPRKSQARMIQNKIGLIARPARQQIMNAFHCEVQLILGVVIEKPQR